MALLGLMCIASLALSWPDSILYNLLRYERNAVVAGEWWRLFSTHFVHGNLNHWLLNAAGLALVIAIFPAYLYRCWWGPAATLVVMALPVGAALHWLSPTLDWYVGMSGLLHGLFANYALQESFKGSRTSLAAILLLAAKLISEQLVGASSTQALVDLPVIVDAHLYGSLAGGILALLLRCFSCDSAPVRPPRPYNR